MRAPLVLACLADGEIALIPEAALAHVDGCDTCTARLGAEALRALVAGEALREVGAAAVSEARAMVFAETTVAKVAKVEALAPTPPASSRRPRRPLPLMAIAAALIVAVAAGLPGFLETAAALRRLLPSAPLLLRVLTAFLRSAPEGLATASLVLTWGSAVLLIVIGSAVALAVTRRRSLQEGGVG